MQKHEGSRHLASAERGRRPRWTPTETDKALLETIFVAPSDVQNVRETNCRASMGVFGWTESFLHHPSLLSGLKGQNPFCTTWPALALHVCNAFW